MRTETVALKFVGFSGWKSIDVAFDVGAAHTGNHNVLYVAKRNLIIVDIFAESSEKRRHRVGGSDKHRRNNLAIFKSYDFGGATSNVDTYYYSHCFVRILSFLG